jgi:hypothetical protein
MDVYLTEEESSILMSCCQLNVPMCGWVGGKRDVLSQARD